MTADRAALEVAAQVALADRDVVAVTLGEGFRDGSPRRTSVMRAIAYPRAGDPFPVVIKSPLQESGGLGRERAALSLIGEHRLPGAVRLLGATSDPLALVLEDLGDGPSVADLLLGRDPVVAGDAVNDWASAVGALQNASTGLGDAFRSRLAAQASAAATTAAGPGTVPSANPLPRWLLDVADRLPALLEPLGVRPTAQAAVELRSLAVKTAAPAPGDALVPGDTCPDNALYVDGRLTLIDFESAAFRDAVWEAAYLVVPWPTCWCSWALPAEVSSRALTTWRQTVAPSIPAVAADTFGDALAEAVIAWAWVAVGFLVPHAASETPGRPASSDRPRPAPRTLVEHRLQLAASYPTNALPALRDLAGELGHACASAWGSHELALAPAFRTDG